ncbi:hypothetical protein LTR64_007767 [Lithohypha guttulata]|uniref:uncharacterized protein n=1 Tax=Lithohypha guttulata TaxID=1690604 RepID=UPI002DE11ECB|nr:hypothetical protein LTR51_007278 [Lithohypha guttulata]
MGDASDNKPTRLPQITDRETHDSIISRENQTANIPIVMYVSSSTPKSRAFTPKMLELSQNPEFKDVKFYEMEMMASTTPMIKFGPQNCPIVFLFRGTWCETLLGIGGIEVVEEHVRGMLARN